MIISNVPAQVLIPLREGGAATNAKDYTVNIPVQRAGLRPADTDFLVGVVDANGVFKRLVESTNVPSNLSAGWSATTGDYYFPEQNASTDTDAIAARRDWRNETYHTAVTIWVRGDYAAGSLYVLRVAQVGQGVPTEAPIDPNKTVAQLLEQTLALQALQNEQKKTITFEDSAGNLDLRGNVLAPKANTVIGFDAAGKPVLQTKADFASGAKGNQTIAIFTDNATRPTGGQIPTFTGNNPDVQLDPESPGGDRFRTGGATFTKGGVVWTITPTPTSKFTIQAIANFATNSFSNVTAVLDIGRGAQGPAGPAGPRGPAGGYDGTITYNTEVPEQTPGYRPLNLPSAWDNKVVEIDTQLTGEAFIILGVGETKFGSVGFDCVIFKSTDHANTLTVGSTVLRKQGQWCRIRRLSLPVGDSFVVEFGGPPDGESVLDATTNESRTSADRGKLLAVKSDNENAIELITAPQGGGGTPDANSVTTRELAADAVETVNIKDNAVTAAKIAPDTITHVEIAHGQVMNDQIANDAVDESKIKARAVGTNELALMAVGEDQLGNAAVTPDKLGANAVTAPKLSDAAVSAAKLASDAVETLKIKDGAVTSAKLAAGVIPSFATTADINVAATTIWTGTQNFTGSATVTLSGTHQWDNFEFIVIHALINNGNDPVQFVIPLTEFQGTDEIGFFGRGEWGLTRASNNTATIVNDSETGWRGAARLTGIVGLKLTASRLTVGVGAITSAMIQNGAVIAGKLGHAAVGQTNIANDAVRNNHILAGNVGTNELADDAVTEAKVADNAIGLDQIKGESAAANKFLGFDASGDPEYKDAPSGGGGGGVPNDNSVTTAKIVDGAVTNVKLASDAVETAKIKDDAVTEAKVADNAIGLDQIKGESAAANKFLGFDASGDPEYKDAPSASGGIQAGRKIATIGKLQISGNTSQPLKATAAADFVVESAFSSTYTKQGLDGLILPEDVGTPGLGFIAVLKSGSTVKSRAFIPSGLLYGNRHLDGDLTTKTTLLRADSNDILVRKRLPHKRTPLLPGANNRSGFVMSLARDFASVAVGSATWYVLPSRGITNVGLGAGSTRQRGLDIPTTHKNKLVIERHGGGKIIEIPAFILIINDGANTVLRMHFKFPGSFNSNYLGEMALYFNGSLLDDDTNPIGVRDELLARTTGAANLYSDMNGSTFHQAVYLGYPVNNSNQRGALGSTEDLSIRFDAFGSGAPDAVYAYIDNRDEVEARPILEFFQGSTTLVPNASVEIYEAVR